MLCQSISGNEEVATTIYEEYFIKDSFWRNLREKMLIFNEKENYFADFYREINRSYDEIVLRNCFIDERIFLEKSSELIDSFNSFNENRSQIHLENKTPLTAEKHFLPSSSSSSSNQHLTPISQTNLLIQQLLHFIGTEQQPSPSSTLSQLLQSQSYLGFSSFSSSSSSSS